MKSRGTNLEKHCDQAFDYRSHIVPKRPPYVILCKTSPAPTKRRPEKISLLPVCHWDLKKKRLL
jgi:hypothetical protein